MTFFRKRWINEEHTIVLRNLQLGMVMIYKWWIQIMTWFPAATFRIAKRKTQITYLFNVVNVFMHFGSRVYKNPSTPHCLNMLHPPHSQEAFFFLWSVLPLSKLTLIHSSCHSWQQRHCKSELSPLSPFLFCLLLLLFLLPHPCEPQGSCLALLTPYQTLVVPKRKTRAPAGVFPWESCGWQPLIS